MNEAHLHLKVCEGCGRLWLRSTGTLNVYCRSCHVNLAQFPAPRGRSRTGRSHKSSLSSGQLLENTGGRQ